MMIAVHFSALQVANSSRPGCLSAWRNRERSKQLADEYNLEFFETSAKSAVNVDAAYDCIAKATKNRYRNNKLALLQDGKNFPI